MSKPTEIVEKMRKKASQSASKFRIAAFGFNHKGECVAKARNIFRFDRKGGGIHAEMKIMQDAMRKRIRTIVICRVGKRGDFLPIDPCPTCQRKADELGIKILSLCVKESE